ncbi:phosphoglycerate mutase [Methylobacterium sp. XJLW]|uniref:phosphoglycerate mutase n=1 Tax=Methylobacterium sp. XJLW TaxID=739141 RepID=UPI000DAAE592|nr:phosphoglycerate mutase [Methylobacterium sp. XJLW]AWV14957.1 phosphoglycerate mutase [Methylobacterium sp. XJLW]
MKAPGYGEDQPRYDDDRLPVVLVLLDGLGDRALPELGGRTPSEAAHTPHLDAFARRGASGWHLPFGWGAAPSSEVAHWSIFGYSGVPFPGRAILEALGGGIPVPMDTATTFACLRTSRVVDGQVRVTGRARRDQRDMTDADGLYEELGPTFSAFGAQVHRLGRGEAIVFFPAFANGEVTDSDPFFEDYHPWLRVRPVHERAADLATHLNTMLLTTRQMLEGNPINLRRAAESRPPLDVLTTKWGGHRSELPAFETIAGVPGAAVTNSRLYRGFCALFALAEIQQPPLKDLADDMRARLVAADALIAGGARFVHVHTKATDEAGHTKDPRGKLEVLEALDAGLEGLVELSRRAVVIVTGDHATPSRSGVLHTSDPTPFVICGPETRSDPVERFGEAAAAAGWIGRIRAGEILPLAFSEANRPVFLGHRATPRPTLALPDRPEPMPLGAPDL